MTAVLLLEQRIRMSPHCTALCEWRSRHKTITQNSTSSLGNNVLCPKEENASCGHFQCNHVQLFGFFVESWNCILVRLVISSCFNILGLGIKTRLKSAMYLKSGLFDLNISFTKLRILLWFAYYMTEYYKTSSFHTSIIGDLY